MNREKTYFYSTLFLTLCSITLLGAGSPLLTLALGTDKTIPFGTLITWIGMISLPLSIYWGIKEFRIPTGKLSRVLSIFIKLLIFLGFLWAPISYVLAGNLSFSFSEKETFQGGQIATKWFWWFSYGIGIGAILTLVTHWISSFIINKYTILKD